MRRGLLSTLPRVLALVATIIGTLLLAVDAAAVTFSDATFTPPDWTAQIIVGGTAAPATQEAIGSPLSGQPSRRVVHTYTSVISVAHLKSGATWDPATQGAITSIDYSYYLLHNSSSSSSAVAYSPLLKQGDSYYVKASDLVFGGLPLTWAAFGAQGLTAASFAKVVGSGPTNPDFTTSGATIELGYFSANSGAGTKVSNIDDWSVTINRTLVFSENFNRADSASLGGTWVEAESGASTFAIGNLAARLDLELGPSGTVAQAHAVTARNTGPRTGFDFTPRGLMFRTFAVATHNGGFTSPYGIGLADPTDSDTDLIFFYLQGENDGRLDAYLWRPDPNGDGTLNDCASDVAASDGIGFNELKVVINATGTQVQAWLDENGTGTFSLLCQRSLDPDDLPTWATLKIGNPFADGDVGLYGPARVGDTSFNDTTAWDTDLDDDGLADSLDNCPLFANLDQADSDQDGVGDVCDNCVLEPNPGQEDGDSDTRGDVCDNCPTTPNRRQFDWDANGIGDLCECWVPFDVPPSFPSNQPPDPLLPPGSQYRLAFVTSATRDAQSTDIADYNAFVSGVANAVPRFAACATTWTAIASTTDVDARDNTGTNPASGAGVPIYADELLGCDLTQGTRCPSDLVAGGNADLWDGSIGSGIVRNESFGFAPAVFAWTGTDRFGTAFSPFGVGAPTRGSVGAIDSEWVRWRFPAVSSVPHPLYAISGVLTVPGCGDGTIQPGEACDDGNTQAGDCCSPTCQLEPSGTVCRAAAGTCDVAETCDGVTDTCPVDGFEPDTTACRAAAGPCDVAELCTGTGVACPADALAPASTECRAAAGACDVVEVCDGVSATCPADAKSTAECRPAAGTCDVAETCDGVADTCPVDGFAPAATECRAAAGACDVAEVCDGASAACPSDAFAPGSTECRAAAGACDLAELCTGASAACPADAKSTAECRPAAGPCDAAETCDGVADTCPVDGFAPDTTECRPAADACDVAELCPGTGTACPADASAADGTSCTDGNPCTDPDTCSAGACVAGDPIPDCTVTTIPSVGPAGLVLLTLMLAALAALRPSRERGVRRS